MKVLSPLPFLLLISCTTPASEFLINDRPASPIEQLGLSYELDGINISQAEVFFFVKNLDVKPITFDQREFTLVDYRGKQNYALDAMERLMGCARRSEPICIASKEEVAGAIQPGESMKKSLRFRDRPLYLPFVLYRLDQRIMEIKRKPE